MTGLDIILWLVILVLLYFTISIIAKIHKSIARDRQYSQDFFLNMTAGIFGALVILVVQRFVELKDAVPQITFWPFTAFLLTLLKAIIWVLPSAVITFFLSMLLIYGGLKLGKLPQQKQIIVIKRKNKK
ncbi:MAG: hypothetical protein V1702_00855 [Candidatus Woesearchaeota archaeon]